MHAACLDLVQLQQKLQVERDAEANRYISQLRLLMSTYGVPDGHVDYEEMWARRFDAARDRYDTRPARFAVVKRKLAAQILLGLCTNWRRVHIDSEAR